MTSKVEQVRLTFEQPDTYLKRWRCNIKIRAETVQEFTRDAQFDRILDIGCGDGSISLPLLTPQNRLTLLDLSSTMLSFARSRIRPLLLKNVEMINEDFMNVKSPRRSYDLILCLGVLAHVDSPSTLVAKMAELLTLDGSIIVETTDSGHFLSHLLRTYDRIFDLVKPRTYTLNVLSSRNLTDMFALQGLHPTAVFRYSFPLPGMHRVFSQESLYKMLRWLFGSYPRRRNAWLGNERIYCFRRKRTSASTHDLSKETLAEGTGSSHAASECCDILGE
jgi:2-polyprenyl-3-methyl-5-hydroxy-6-metoxy-1,4-benzoquinol methylase